MQKVSDDFIRCLKSSSREFDAYLQLENMKIQKSEISTFTIEGSIGSSDVATLGGTNIKKLSCEILNTSNSPVIPTGMIVPKIGIRVNRKFEYVSMGQFYIAKDSIKSTGLVITFDAYDRMMYYNSYAFNSDASLSNSREVLLLLRDNYNLKINDINSYDNINLQCSYKGKTVRQVLGDLALLFGKNALFDREGYLIFTKNTKVDFNIDAENYIKFKTLDSGLSKISKITTTVEGVEISSGNNTGSVLEVSSSNITSQNDIDQVYSNVGFPIVYQAYELECQGNPILDVGDILTLTTNKKIVHELPVITHKMTFNGGLVSSFKASATPKNIKNNQTSMKEELSNLQIKIEQSNSEIYGSIARTEEEIGEILEEIGILQENYDTVSGEAARAQVSADGKNKVFYSSEEPANTEKNDLKLNDLWFDTDDGNCSYRWNGSKWEKKQYGSGAIDNLDVGKLTGGTIAAILIAAEDIKAKIAEFGKITADLIAVNDLNAICATLTNAKITGKITTNELTVTGGAYIQSSNYVDGVSGFRFDLETGQLLGNEFWAKNGAGNMRVNYGNWGPAFHRKMKNNEWQETARIITSGQQYVEDGDYFDGLYIGNGDDGNYILFEAGNTTTSNHPKLMLTDGLGVYRKGLHLYGGGNFDVSLDTSFLKGHSGRSNELIWGGMSAGSGCNVDAGYNFYTIQAWTGVVGSNNTWVYVTIPKNLIGYSPADLKTIVANGKHTYFSLFYVDGVVRFWHQGGDLDVYSITGTD